MSISVFDNKIFNGEVFQGYVDRIPNPKRNELIKSRAIRPRPELAATLGDHDGGNYMTSAMNGLLSGSTVVNYDGQTDISSNSSDTYKHSRVVVGRGGAWTERDFSYDNTGGKDFIENIAEQISEFKEELDQGTIINILNGVFNMSDDEGKRRRKGWLYRSCNREQRDSEGLRRQQGQVQPRADALHRRNKP